MPLYRNEQNILLFVHIPKTGGSTIENTLKSKGVVQAFHSRMRLGKEAVTPQHMHREVIRRWIPEAFYDAAFCVVRNPFARIASEYKWQKQIRNANVSTFDTWANNQIARQRENEFYGDNHIRPQSDFVWDGLKVFWLEAGLEEPLAFAMAKLGLSTDPKEAVPMRNDARTETVRLELTNKTLENIRAFYWKDFEAFGYAADEKINDLFHIV